MKQVSIYKLVKKYLVNEFDGLNYSDALNKVNELEDYEDLYWTKLLTENKKHNISYLEFADSFHRIAHEIENIITSKRINAKELSDELDNGNYVGTEDNYS